mmetsp:Transcript_16921/g.38865  ORF Transcript_16921/g.38865 Transcript_16921/m.38865 type:complete len:83 (-) Transcript_16921:2199-2447(-)
MLVIVTVTVTATTTASFLLLLCLYHLNWVLVPPPVWRENAPHKIFFRSTIDRVPSFFRFGHRDDNKRRTAMVWECECEWQQQ